MDNIFCVFLTGTIAPSSNILNLAHKKAQTREQDYIYAIKQWLLLPYPIVFCENSNYQSEKLDKLFELNPHCQYIKFLSNRNSKGEGEADIFKFAFSNSSLLQKSHYIIKCTGRYHIKNASNILKKILKLKIYENVEICADLSRSLTYSDSRFFIFRPSFYFNSLILYINMVNEDNEIYFEHCLARSIHYCLAEGLKWSYLPEPIICIGIYGTGGFKYKNDFIRIQKRKFILKIKQKIICL